MNNHNTGKKITTQVFLVFCNLNHNLQRLKAQTSIFAVEGTKTVLIACGFFNFCFLGGDQVCLEGIS